ncbi:YciI family protein [Aquamicrobium sp. LC103]|uniref:YciI family protein n=1 Tax=Aquamicrobium sp. LC103 TaxID=1120658 RepID=UPI00063ECB66|nr:YciI family protein [Aquamicrobium sp. LC103]TKT83017.1 YciI family protein [Aquamicrobium sp. LC103]
MLYALLCYNSEDAMAALSNEEEAAMMARIRAVEEKIVLKSRMGPTMRLKPTGAAKFARAGKPSAVVDGPYAETKEQLLGFWILDCESMDDAVEAARLIAGERAVGGIEIRPIAEFNPA